jgi:hypothetical protein
VLEFRGSLGFDERLASAEMGKKVGPVMISAGQSCSVHGHIKGTSDYMTL